MIHLFMDNIYNKISFHQTSQNSLITFIFITKIQDSVDIYICIQDIIRN